MWWCGGGGNFPIVIPLQVRQLCFALHPDCGNFIVKMIVQNVSTDPVKPIKRRSVKINLVFLYFLSIYPTICLSLKSSGCVVKLGQILNSTQQHLRNLR